MNWPNPNYKMENSVVDNAKPYAQTTDPEGYHLQDMPSGLESLCLYYP